MPAKLNRLFLASMLLLPMMTGSQASAFEKILVAQAESKSVEEVIRSQARAYEKAFNNKDAKTIAGMWAENGTYSDDQGDEYVGRAQIETRLNSFFKHSGQRRIRIVIDSIKPLGEHAAIERGIGQIRDAAGKVLSTAPYTVVHVNNGGKWEMASVTEHAAEMESTASLDSLRWLSGEWQAKGKDGDANLSTRWMADRTFLVANFRVKLKNGETHEDVQVIGVDRRRGRIVSWLFDSEGGAGRGAWFQNGKSWCFDMVRTTPDGSKMSARNVLEPQGSDLFTWQSINRKVDGVTVPDSEKLTVNRIHLGQN